MSRVMPWDIINMILNMTGRESLKVLKLLDRQFYSLCSKRKTGLTFTQRNVTEKMFFRLIERSTSISTFQIKTTFANISPTSMASFMI